jgi:hypothetical protein
MPAQILFCKFKTLKTWPAYRTVDFDCSTRTGGDHQMSIFRTYPLAPLPSYSAQQPKVRLADRRWLTAVTHSGLARTSGRTFLTRAKLDRDGFDRF